MLLFFDTEFTGLYKNTNLISIGIVDENGRAFYGEINDIDVDLQDSWIIDNVLANTIYYGDKYIEGIDDEDTISIGSKEEIKNKLIDWLAEYNSVQFISDVCHYDFVLLIDLFGTAFDLPDKINPSCHDINQDIADYLLISEKEAFNYNRENFLINNGKVVEGNKHNSLYDARVIKEIFDIIKCS